MMLLGLRILDNISASLSCSSNDREMYILPSDDGFLHRLPKSNTAPPEAWHSCLWKISRMYQANDVLSRCGSYKEHVRKKTSGQWLILSLMLYHVSIFGADVWKTYFRRVGYTVTRSLYLLCDKSSCPMPVPVPVEPEFIDMISGAGLGVDRKSTRLNSSHSGESRMPSSA